MLFNRACVLPLLCFALSRTLASSAENHTTWSDYSGAADSAQYSSLKQIDRSNVSQLKVAWSYSTGDEAKYSFNPLMVYGRLYVLAKNNSIVALDAVTGREIWNHPTDPNTRLITNRGINYWESNDRSDRRLLFSCNNHLEALDARTGSSIDSFGTGGRVDLREGFGRDPKSLSMVQSTTPGRVFGDLVILGSATNQGYGSAPGDIRAFDIRTGKLVWSFHTIPHPGEFGYETWPKEAWKTAGGANAWSELSIDENRGIIYIPTASPKYNFYGADRKGANLFGDCLLALDARTGKRIWHFQMVHHDIWDYDNATAPKLITVRHDGRMVDAVAQVGKEGFVWVFNRVTGEPLWPIEERPVPHSDMPGEETWPTQPFPLKPPPFARQSFTIADLSPFIEDAAERERFTKQIRDARNEGLFTPPGRQNTIEMPGNNGGANWGGAAVDPTRGYLYVVSKDLPAMLKLERERKVKVSATDTPVQMGQSVYDAKCHLCHGADQKGQPPVVPSLIELSKRLNREQTRNVVTHGQGQMPAFPKLSGEELDSLIGFLFRPPGPTALRPPSVEVDSVTPDDGAPVHYVSGFGFMVTSAGVSPIAPPWTSLTAYDLNTGTIRWKIPLGDVPELAEKGIKNTGVHYPKVGPVVTAGGLIFAGTRDGKARALDADTGKILWEAKLDAGLEGMPAVYELGGRQYVVFCAAAQAGIRPGTQSRIHGAYVAFALPERAR